MTLQEFSNEFDIMLNSFSKTGKSFVADEYEKSVYLTQAESVIVRAYYLGATTTGSFDSNENLKRELEPLIKTITLNPSAKINTLNDKFIHTVFKLPNNLMFIVFESLKADTEELCIKDKIFDIVPEKHDNYSKVKKDPFKCPNNRKFIRLDNDLNSVELIGNYPVLEYQIRYIEKPSPIILQDFEDLSIEGISVATPCKLPRFMHVDILTEAVKMFINSRAIVNSDTK